MKKLLLPVCLLFSGVIITNAQGIAIGARAGVNFANESISGGGFTASPDSRTSFLLGAYAKIMFSDKMGIQPELFYSSLGAKSGSDVLKTNYLSLPIFFRYNVTENVHFLAGPSFSMLLSAKDESGGSSADVKDQFNTMDIGVVPGIGVDFGPFNAGIRYSIGVSNIAKDASSGYTVKNTAFQIVAGYKLFGK